MAQAFAEVVPAGDCLLGALTVRPRFRELVNADGKCWNHACTLVEADGIVSRDGWPTAAGTAASSARTRSTASSPAPPRRRRDRRGSFAIATVKKVNYRLVPGPCEPDLAAPPTPIAWRWKTSRGTGSGTPPPRTARAALERVGGDKINYMFAWIEAQRGAIEAAFAALDRARAGRQWLLIMARSDRFFAPLRADPASPRW